MEHTTHEPNLTKQERRQVKKERKTQERQAQRASGRNRALTRWLIGLAVVAGALYGIATLVSRSNATRPGQDIPEQGKQHISVGEDHPAYNSNPPTSGPHYSAPTDWGVYQYELTDENVIHSLEHGGIWVSYANINDDTKTKLAAIGRRYPHRIVVSPRAANDAPIAVASWGRLLKLDTFDESAIVEFIKQNTNKSPERLAR